jgi:murein DD-endopeptidase MepM/ murein hydrolase activator NlpD
MAIKYNSRTAQANAKQQELQHQGAVAQNQATGNVGNYSSQQFVPQNQPLVDQYGKQTNAGILNQAQQNATQGKTSYDTSTGAVTGAGAINQSAVQRLENAGMSGSQIQNQMNGLQDNIQQTMGNTGLGVQYDANGNVIAGSGRLDAGQTMSNTPVKTKEQQRQDELNNIRITATRQVGTDDRGNPIYADVFDPGATEAAKQAAKTRFATEDQNVLTQKGQTVQKMGQNAAGDAASGQTQAQAVQTAGSAGLDATLANLPPELSFLGPILQNVQQTGQESLNTLKETSGKIWDNMQAGFNEQKGQIDQMKEEYKSSSGAIQDLLKTVRDDQQKNITEQETAAKERLAWNELQQTRQINEQKRKAVDTQVASLALRGGFGSSAGLDKVEEVSQHYEQALSDLQSEMGVQRTELAAKFTALHTQVTESYTQSSIENIKDLRTGIQNLNMQGMANARAKMEAENALAQTFMTNQISIRQDMAKSMQDGATQVASIIRQEKADKAQLAKQEYENSWEQFKFEQEQIYKYDSLNAANEDRDLARELSYATKEENTAIRRDDKEKYNAELVRGKIQSQIEASMVFDQYKQAKMSWDALATAYQQKDNPFRDRAMAKSYEKLVEVGSVVMPGEYADITSNVPLLSKIQGKLDKVVNGGQSWTDAERAAIKDLSENLYKAYETRRNEESQIPLSAIQFHNQNTANPSYHLKPSMFNLPEPISSFQTTGFTNQLPPGYKSPFSSPNGGGGTVLPKENSKIQTGFVSGTVTGYGSKYWDAGVDISAPKGAPIKTPIEGVVEKVVYNSAWKGTPNNKQVGMKQNGGFGNQVKVKYPDGVQIQFSHADSLPFGKEMEGKPIPPGAILGYVGNTGNTYGATGVHVDITGYKPDGELMTAKEVTKWMLSHS